ncbi:MAG: Omp28-related outer membrane protein [Bacteroidota bacterium]
MKKAYLIILLISSSFLYLSSCDKVEKTEQTPTESPTTEVKIRKTFLEIYVGHKCPNCPTGNYIIQNLKALYGDSLVVLTIHAGFYATVDVFGDFTYDFNTSVGTELDNFFGVGMEGNPNCMVNRTGFNSNHIISPYSMGSIVITELHKAPNVNLKLTPTYNASTRNLQVEVDANFLTNLSDTYMLGVYIKEDSIVKPQKNSDPNLGAIPIIYDYVHHDVLRGSFNGSWGDTLVSGNSAPGHHLIKNYSLTLNTEWREKFCSVVAFIYRKSDYEIIQAEEIKVIP